MDFLGSSTSLGRKFLDLIFCCVGWGFLWVLRFSSALFLLLLSARACALHASGPVGWVCFWEGAVLSWVCECVCLGSWRWFLLPHCSCRFLRESVICSCLWIAGEILLQRVEFQVDGMFWQSLIFLLQCSQRWWSMFAGLVQYCLFLIVSLASPLQVFPYSWRP